MLMGHESGGVGDNRVGGLPEALSGISAWTRSTAWLFLDSEEGDGGGRDRGWRSPSLRPIGFRLRSGSAESRRTAAGVARIPPAEARESARKRAIAQLNCCRAVDAPGSCWPCERFAGSDGNRGKSGPRRDRSVRLRGAPPPRDRRSRSHISRRSSFPAATRFASAP